MNDLVDSDLRRCLVDSAVYNETAPAGGRYSVRFSGIFAAAADIHDLVDKMIRKLAARRASSKRIIFQINKEKVCT